MRLDVGIQKCFWKRDKKGDFSCRFTLASESPRKTAIGPPELGIDLDIAQRDVRQQNVQINPKAINE
jgi:hypothetical protein